MARLNDTGTGSRCRICNGVKAIDAAGSLATTSPVAVWFDGSRASAIPAVPTRQGTTTSHAALLDYGAMLWLRWKTFSGSYRRFTSTRRP